MEHHNKYYLGKVSDFDIQRVRPPPTNYGEQRRHNNNHSYKELLKELTNLSAKVFDAVSEFPKKLRRKQANVT